jgi:hypothetical protein
MAILVMLNNYLHDLATAVFAVSALASWFLLRSTAARRAPEALRPVIDGLVKVGFFSLAWTLAGGVVRSLAFRRYEWMEAAGRSQIPALVVKHVILVTLVTAGVVVLYKVRRLTRAAPGEEAFR